MDWNDLKLFLAVVRHGSIRAAAVDLGVNQSTVNRRMDVLEHDLNLVLFERTTRGFVLTEHGQAIASAALPMSERAEAVLAEADRQRRSLAGGLKITAPHAIGAAVVAPIIEVFRARYPEVIVELDGSERMFDLWAGEADVAFRAAFSDPDPLLESDLVHVHGWAVYCSKGFAGKMGMPGSLEDLRRFPIVAMVGALGGGPGNAWLMKSVDPAQIVGAANSVPNMTNILRAGLGVGFLPSMVGESDGDLVRCFGPVAEAQTRLWIVTTPESRRRPRVAAFVKTALAWFRAEGATRLERRE